MMPLHLHVNQKHDDDDGAATLMMMMNVWEYLKTYLVKFPSVF